MRPKAMGRPGRHGDLPEGHIAKLGHDLLGVVGFAD